MDCSDIENQLFNIKLNQSVLKNTIQENKNISDKNQIQIDALHMYVVNLYNIIEKIKNK